MIVKGGNNPTTQKLDKRSVVCIYNGGLFSNKQGRMGGGGKLSVHHHGNQKGIKSTHTGAHLRPYKRWHLGGAQGQCEMSEAFRCLLWPSVPSVPRPSDPLLPSPARPTPPHTAPPPIRHQCSGKEPAASLGKLPGPGPGLPAERAGLGARIILESPSGVRPPPRSVVPALELAEVTMGLAWGVVSLRKKPEMALTNSSGRAREDSARG